MRPTFSDRLADGSNLTRSGRRCLAVSLLLAYFGDPTIRSSYFAANKYKGSAKLFTALRSVAPDNTAWQQRWCELMPVATRAALHVCTDSSGVPSHYISLVREKAFTAEVTPESIAILLQEDPGYRWRLNSNHVRESARPYHPGMVVRFTSVDFEGALREPDAHTELSLLSRKFDDTVDVVIADWELRRMASHCAVIAEFHGAIKDDSLWLSTAIRARGKASIIPNWKSADGWIEPFTFSRGELLPHARGVEKAGLVTYGDAVGFDLRGHEFSRYVLPHANRPEGRPPQMDLTLLNHFLRTQFFPIVVLQIEPGAEGAAGEELKKGEVHYCGLSYTPSHDNDGESEIVSYHIGTRLIRRFPWITRTADGHYVLSTLLVHKLLTLWLLKEPRAYAQAARLDRIAKLFEYLRLPNETEVRIFYARHGIDLPDDLPKLEWTGE